MSKLLIVGSIEFTRFLIRKTACERVGVDQEEVKEVRTADCGVEAFQKFHPKVVVVDIMMPRERVLDLIAKILKIKAETRIVAVSGYPYGAGTDSLVEEVLTAGVFRHISKPFVTPEEVQGLAKVLSDALTN